jgi:heme-degrading monooxygenase HmoA
MHMRVLRGRVFDGREPDFVELSRRQVAGGARAPGLLAFMAGYRRSRRTERTGTAERFLMVSTWEDEAAAQAVTGATAESATQSLAGIVEVESVGGYELIPPVFTGILDAPGAVIRLSEARLRPGGRDELLRWLHAKEREVRSQRWLMGWAMGERREPDGAQVLISASAWASPLMIEQFGEPGRAPGLALFSELDDLVTDFHVERYQAIEMALPATLADVGGRRVIAARFDSEEDALSARATLAESVVSASEAGISVARLSADVEGDTEPRILVARVSMADYPVAERMIADLGGQVILAHDDLAEDQPANGDQQLNGSESLATT